MYARDNALIATPIGMVRVTGTSEVVESVEILDERVEEIAPEVGAVALAADQLREWFAGNRQHFDLPLVPSTTPRGQALRNGMIAIPFGATISYGGLAAIIASSARAVGQACSRNPLPIIVPCHRVLDASGALGAYSAGAGPTTKFWLLDHERRLSGRTLL